MSALMRASHMRSNLVALGQLSRAHERDVRAQVPEAVKAINASVRTAWLPIELDVELSEAVERVCGQQGFLHWCREAIYETTRGPLLGPILTGLQRLGLGPRHALRRLPAGWNMIYRGCGTLHLLEESDEYARIEVESVPSSMHGVYAQGIGAAFEAIITCVGAKNPDMGLQAVGESLRFDVTWRLESARTSVRPAAG